MQLLGPQSYETLAATYQSSDVFVMPTLDDYRALVGFEALAQGLPILHSRWDGAVHEVIQPAPHENGFVIDPKDTAGFAAQMRWMVEHPAERARMGLQSQTASSRYTISNAVDSLSAAILRCRDC